MRTDKSTVAAAIINQEENILIKLSPEIDLQQALQILITKITDEINLSTMMIHTEDQVLYNSFKIKNNIRKTAAQNLIDNLQEKNKTISICLTKFSKNIKNKLHELALLTS